MPNFLLFIIGLSFEESRNEHEHAKTKEVHIAQELGAGKCIKKPYTLQKVGLAVKEELEKYTVSACCPD